MEIPSNEMNSLVSLQQSLQTRRESLAKNLEILDEELKAVEITLRLLRNGNSSTGQISALKVQPVFISHSSKIDFTGMTQPKALVAIALTGQGRLKITDARKVLEKAGILRHTKNGYNILYNVITKSGKFERSAPGEYRLLSQFEQMINRVVAGENPSKLVDELLAK